MLEALISGQRDPAVIADLAQRRMRSKIPALTEALTGRFSEHHSFMLDVDDVRAVLLDPGIPVAGLGRPVYGLLELRECLCQLVSREHLARHLEN